MVTEPVSAQTARLAMSTGERVLRSGTAPQLGRGGQVGRGWCEESGRACPRLHIGLDLVALMSMPAGPCSAGKSHPPQHRGVAAAPGLDEGRSSDMKIHLSGMPAAPDFWKLGWVKIIALSGGCALVLQGLTGCSPVETVACTGGDGPGVVALISATKSDVYPALPPRVFEKVGALAASEDVTDGPGGRGVPAVVSSADGQFFPAVDLTPRRGNCQVDHSSQRERLIQKNIHEFADTVASVTAKEPGLDLVQALADAVAGRDPGLLIIVSHGLSTRGAFDIRQVGWIADPADIVAQLRDRNLLPSGLAGWRVVWVGLGATAGDQAPLPFSERATLKSYWRGICEAAGAVSCDFDDTRLDNVASGATAEMPLVEVNGVSSVVGPHGEISATISDEVLGFEGNSAALSAPGLELIEQFAGRVEAADLSERPGASLVVTGFCADPPESTPAGLEQLSLARAQAVALALDSALAQRGITLPVRGVGGGVAPGTTAMVDGVFVEPIAATMRRVEIKSSQEIKNDF